MDDKTLWGAIILAYMLPALWIFIKLSDNFERNEARRKLYPGQKEVAQEDNILTKVSLLWGVGLVALLVAWKANWPPIGVAITLFIAIMAVFVVGFTLKKRAEKN